MSVDIRTNSIKPLRNTFRHLQKRFGDKTPTRYQEIAYDIQSETNFHYKPLWEPERDLYDRRRTGVVMADWYALKDPRQYYYGSYTTTRARQQDALDRQLEFVEKKGLLNALPDELKQRIVSALLPLRHYEWGANMNNCHIAAYGWGTAITQAAMMHVTDRLGMAQHVSRIGLLLDGNSGESLASAKATWTDHPAWQGVRREVERMFVTRDWFELMVAQNLVADGLIYPLCYERFDAELSANGAGALTTLTDYLVRWFEECSKWVDATIKTAAAESPENLALISGWTRHWRDAWLAALLPITEEVLGAEAQKHLDGVAATFNARASKLGLKL